MEKKNVFDLKTVETKSKQLAYTEDIERFIKEHPKVMMSVVTAIKELRNTLKLLFESSHVYGRRYIKSLPAFSNGEPLYIEDAETGVKVTYLDFGAANKYFKAEINGHEFFIKTETREHEKLVHFSGHNAYNEALSSARAKELLKDLPWVEVPDYKMAYRDKNLSYFVAKWRDLPSLEGFLSQLAEENNMEQYNLFNEKIEHRLKILQERLLKYGDVKGGNILYDEKSDKFVLIDLHEELNDI